MAKRENAASRMNLRTDILDDLFGLSEENNDTETMKEDSYVNLNQLITFKNYPFTVAHDESMDSLVESIKEHGLIHPLAVRKISDSEYEILSGYRRKMACEILGMEKVPVLLIAYSIYCGVTRTYSRQFNLHKTNAANEELFISLCYGREVQERGRHTDCSIIIQLSNKMDNSLLAVRVISHKYIVVEQRKKNIHQILL